MTSRMSRIPGWWLGGGMIAAMAVVGATASGDAAFQRGQPAPLTQVMRVKLDASQAVLRALVTEDFPALERGANQLGALTKSPEWGVLKTPDYARHSAEFLRETANLAASARAGDLNAAALDYAALTFKCVQCHRHVKGARKAD
jgi:hypothetical protein